MKGKFTLKSEEEIDQTVIEQAGDDHAWEAPVRVRRAKSAPLTMPAQLLARAAFVARLHREINVEEWLRRVIQERIEMEEAAFVELKRDLAEKRAS